MTGELDPIGLAERKCPTPSLHQAREQSKATWARDLQGLYEHAKERFADVKWVETSNNISADMHEAEYLKDGDGSIGVEAMEELLQAEPSREDTQSTDVDAVFAHKAIVYARAPKAFKERFFPVFPAGGSSNALPASDTAQSSISSFSAPDLLRHGLRTKLSTSSVSVRSSSQRSFPRDSLRPFSQSATRIGLDHSEPVQDDFRTMFLQGTPSLSSRPPTASSYRHDDRISSHIAGDDEGVLTLSHHGTPEMLKHALEWLYTARDPRQGTDAATLGYTELDASDIVKDQGFRRSDASEEIGLISAKGVDGKNMVQGKKLTIGRIRLAQDLTYMWRSRLYTDVRIRISPPKSRLTTSSESGKPSNLRLLPPSAYKSTANGLRRLTSFSSIQLDDQSQSFKSDDDQEFDIENANHDGNGTVFSAHRFVLCSRSPYFHQVLLNSGAFQSHPAARRLNLDDSDYGEIPEIVLPSPPFTPVAIYFILGYLYSGSLTFSHHTPDLPAAFSIMKSAIFLEMDTLVAELEAFIREELCHGMTYPTAQRGKKVAGCACKKCSKRIPKVLRFALAPDVQAPHLKDDAMRYLVQGGWAECWNKDLAYLDENVQDTLMEEIGKQVSVDQIPAMYRKISDVEKQMETERGEWVDTLRDMLEIIRSSISQKVLESFFDFARESAFVELLTDGSGDRSLRDVILRDLKETVNKAEFCRSAPRVYQVITSELMKATVGPQRLPLLPLESNGREAIENTRTEILAIIRRRWLQMRPAGTFDELEDWALQEISKALEVDHEELLKPKTPVKRKPESAKPGIIVKRPISRLKVAQLGSKQQVTDRPASSLSSAIVPTETQSVIGSSASRNGLLVSTAVRRGNNVNVPSATNPSQPSSRSSMTASPSGPLIANRQRTISEASLVNRRASPSAQVSSSRTSSRLASSSNPAGPARNVGAEANPQTGSRALHGGNLPARGRTSSTPSPLGVASTAPLRQRSALPTSDVTPLTTGLTTRLASTRSLRQDPEPTAPPNTVAIPRIQARRPSPITGQGLSIPTAGTLRSSASSASLRLRATQTQGGSPARVVKKIVPSSQKPTTVNSSSLRIRPTRKTDGTSSTSGPEISKANTDGSKNPIPRIASQRGPLVLGISSTLQRKSPTPAARTTNLDEVRKLRGAPALANPSEAADARDSLVKISPPTASTGTVAGGEMPSRALRPLKLVEKRHSIGPSQARGINRLLTVASPGTEPGDNLPGRVKSEDASSALASPVQCEPHFDELAPDRHQNDAKKQSSCGLGLGVPLLPPSTRTRKPSIASPVLSSNASGKYHPASAFDPPPRIPSISVTGSAQEEEGEDDCIPHDKAKGISLAIGIPCVIHVTPPFSTPEALNTTLAPSRTRLKAVCRYIGQVDGKSGEWIGVEIDQATLKRLRGDPTDVSKEAISGEQHDGSWNGIRYYKIHNNPLSGSSNIQSSFSRPASPLSLHYRVSQETLNGRLISAAGGLGPALTTFETSSFSPRVRGNSMDRNYKASSVREPTSDGSMSILSNPETSRVSGGNDTAASQKCGLWIKPSDVLFIPGAHE